MKYILLNKEGYIEGIANSDIKPTYATEKMPPKVFPGMCNKFNYEKNEWEQIVGEIPEYDEFNYDVSFTYDGWEKKEKKIKHEERKTNNNYERNILLYKIHLFCKDLVDSYEGKIRDNSEKEITVLIPCYNKSSFIIETIDSVLKQTILPKKIEILLMDEKSIAMKDEILKKSDLISVEVCERKDIIESRNYLVDKCETKDFIFLDADDLLYDNFIEECSKIDCYFIFPPPSTKNKNLYSRPFHYTKSFIYNSIVGNLAGLMNKEKFIEIGKLDPIFNKINEDHELKLRAIQSNYAVGFPETTSYYMRRDEDEKYLSTSTLFAKRKASENFNILRKHSDFLLSNINKTSLKGTTTAQILKKYFNALDTLDYTEEEYEMLYYYFYVIEKSSYFLDFNEEIGINKEKKIYSNISWISSDISEIISKLPYKLFKEIEIKHETNNVVTSKEDMTICLYANKHPQRTIDSIESMLLNDFKDIIVFISDENIISIIKEKYPFITIIEDSSLDIREASKIMAKQTKKDWLLLTDSSVVFVDAEEWIDEITINPYDVLFLKGCDETLITFKQYFKKNNSCIIHRSLFDKTNGFSNDYDFTLDCYKNGKCDFTVYPLINALIPNNPEFTLKLSFYETLKKHKDILEDIIKIYKKYPSNTRNNAVKFMKNMFKNFDPTYEFLNKILLEN